MDFHNQETLAVLTRKMLEDAPKSFHMDLLSHAGTPLALLIETLATSYNDYGFHEALEVISPSARLSEMKRWVTLVVAAVNLFCRVALAIGIPIKDWPNHLEIRPAHLFSVYGYKSDRGFTHGVRQTLESLCILASFCENPMNVNVIYGGERVDVARFLLPQSSLVFLRDHPHRTEGKTQYHAFARHAASPLLASKTPAEMISTASFSIHKNGPAHSWKGETLELVRAAHKELLGELLMRDIPNALGSPEMMAANAKLAMAGCRLCFHIIDNIPLVVDGAGIKSIWIRGENKCVVGVDASKKADIVKNAVKVGIDHGHGALVKLIDDVCDDLKTFFAPPAVSPTEFLDERINWSDFMAMDEQTAKTAKASRASPLRPAKRLRIMNTQGLKANMACGLPRLYRPGLFQ